MNQTEVKAYGTESAEAPLNQLSIRRREPTPHDVEIEIAYCGVWGKISLPDQRLRQT